MKIYYIYEYNENSMKKLLKICVISQFSIITNYVIAYTTYFNKNPYQNV